MSSDRGCGHGVRVWEPQGGAEGFGVQVVYVGGDCRGSCAACVTFEAIGSCVQAARGGAVVGVHAEGVQVLAWAQGHQSGQGH